MRWTVRELLASLLLGLAAVALLAPLELWVLLHDAESYRWLINGPSPLDQLGSGPASLWFGVGSVSGGLLLFLVATAVKGTVRR